ncbi:bifunctional metallophosphatase/5'-nucleotidase [Alkalihalobacillus deserti]|uniref:bifunctional metallophosphatase/5'-nucleotidase n=1 Tax=Alkalihalobacillus deserti TaxID=2879466 RepID=UPI001D153F7C|nr:bifunctional UDP-sugar hydrolase/5'-nucleotidase [Alkalihalobacillus deserti]
MAIKQLTIFHTNDIHSCFDNWSQTVAYIKKNRDENTLYLELGDHTDRSNALTEATYGKGNVELLNEAGVDYGTIGNNEGITFSKDQLESLYEQATFPVIVANVFSENEARPKWMKPFVIHTMKSGLKIGVIGITAPFSRFYEQLGWKVKAPLPLLKELLPQVRKQADIVIFMSHLGLTKDEEIAERISGIDVILGAHTHHVLPNGKWVGDTLIAQTGKHGAFLGKVTLDYDDSVHRIKQRQASLLDLKEKPKDLDTDKILERMKVQASEILSEPIAVIPKPLPVHWQKQTEFGQLLCDAVTEWCGKEIGMLNAGVLLESLEQGVVTKADIHRICPHPINPCTVKVTGAQLEKTIKRALTKELTDLELKGFGFRGKILGVMLFTGIEIEQQSSMIQIKVLNKPLNKEKVYSVATLDMYTFGYLFPDFSDSTEKQYFMPEFLRDVLAWKLTQKWA